MANDEFNFFSITCVESIVNLFADAFAETAIARTINKAAAMVLIILHN